MARVRWEIDSFDEDIYQDDETQENYFPEARAIKHAKNICDKYFDSAVWVYEVQLDCGSVYTVDLAQNTCVKVK